MPRLRRPTLVLLLSAAALAAGCGGDGGDPVVDRDAVLHLELDEYRIEPQVIEVRSATFPLHVHIVARNSGHLAHNVKIEAEESGAEQGTDVQPTVYGGTDRTAQPGQTTSGDVALWPGTYRMTCTIANHDNLGQYGTLIVKKTD